MVTSTDNIFPFTCQIPIFINDGADPNNPSVLRSANSRLRLCWSFWMRRGRWTGLLLAVNGDILDTKRRRITRFQFPRVFLTLSTCFQLSIAHTKQKKNGRWAFRYLLSFIYSFFLFQNSADQLSLQTFPNKANWVGIPRYWYRINWNLNLEFQIISQVRSLSIQLAPRF